VAVLVTITNFLVRIGGLGVDMGRDWGELSLAVVYFVLSGIGVRKERGINEFWRCDLHCMVWHGYGWYTPI